MYRRRAALVALVLLLGGARAAITVVSTTTLVTEAVGPAVTISFGPGGSESRFFSWSLSTNATHVSGTMLGRAGADWYAKDVLRLTNARAGPQSVTLSAPQLVNAQLDVFGWHVYDGTTLIGTLDMESVGPSITFSLPGSTTYRVDARLDLAEGAGTDNAPMAFDVGIRIGTGGILVTHAGSAPALGVSTVQVPIGKLATGSAVGANATNGTASINAPTLLVSDQDALYLNNTAGSPWWVKLVHVASSSISDLSTANIGVNNGTLVEHVRISGGAVTQSGGDLQRLEPSSTNRVYVRSLEGLLFDGATIDLDIYASPDATGDSYLLSKARITLT